MAAVDMIPWEAVLRGSFPSAMSLHLLRLCAAGESCTSERVMKLWSCLFSTEGKLRCGWTARRRWRGRSCAACPLCEETGIPLGYRARYKSDNADYV